MFVRRKKVKGNTYYQLVRNVREDGKHKQQFLCHLGPHKSLEAAIAAERKLAEIPALTNERRVIPFADIGSSSGRPANRSKPTVCGSQNFEC